MINNHAGGPWGVVFPVVFWLINIKIKIFFIFILDGKEKFSLSTEALSLHSIK